MTAGNTATVQAATGTILIVDDMPTNLGIVVEGLEDYGYKVLIAQDGEEGLMRAELVQPDLILLDVMMPVMDGLELCRHLKAKRSTQDIPVIFMTSLADTEDKLSGFRAGAVDYVTKPFQIDEIIARITTHLKLRAMQKQLESQNEELHRYREHLEQQVAERTAELSKSNLWLREEIEERKHANERLELMDFALNHVREAAYLIDQFGHFFYVNAEACRILGYNREELLGMGVPDIDLAMMPDEWKQHWAELQQSGSLTFERAHRNKLGEIIPVEISANYFEYKGSGFNLALVRDITDRKAAERALQDQTLWLKTLLQTIPDPVWVKDMDGTFISCNGAFSKIFDRSVEETLGRRDADFIDAERANFFLQKDREAAAAGRQVVNEEWIKYLPDGRPVLWETVKTPLYDAVGKLVGVLGVARDITERKRLEEELRAKDQYQRALLDNFPFMVWLKDTESRFLAVNKPFAEAAGLPSVDDFFGKSDLDIWPRTLAEAYRAGDREALQTGRSKAVEEQLVRENELRWVETYKAPVVVDGRLLGTVGFSRDITDEKAAQLQLRLLHYAMDKVGESALLMDPYELTFIYVNQTASLQLGYSREELTGGMNVFDIDPDWTREKHAVALEAYAEVSTDQPFIATFESRHRAKDGRIYPVEIVSNVFEFDNKRYKLAVCRDISERKLAQEALQKSEQRYREIFENASDAMYLLEVTEDRRFRYLEVNEAFESCLGMPRNSMAGQYAGVACATPAARKIMLAKYSRCLESGKLYEEEISLDTVGGHRTLHSTLIPLFDSHGRMDRIIGISRDITESKRRHLLEKIRAAMLEQLAEGASLQKALSLAAGYLEKLHSEFLCTIMTVDETGTRLEVGSGLRMPENLLAALDGIMIGKSTAPCATAAACGAAVIAEDVRKHPYGAPYKHLTLEAGLLSCWSIPIFDSLSKVAGTLDIYQTACGQPTEEHLSIARQTTHLAAMAIERKRLDAMQQKRLELEQRLSRLAAHAPGMMFIYRLPPDGKATFPYASQAILDLFGVTPEAAAEGIEFLDALTHQEDKSRFDEATRISAYGLLPFHCDFRINHPTKGEIWIEARSTPEREADGSTLWHGFMHDITERKQAEALLHRHEQEFRSLAENSPDAIARLDTQGRYVYINQRLQKLIGLPLEQLIGKKPMEIRDLPGLHALQAKVEEALQGYDTEMIHLVERNSENLRIHDHVRFVPEFDPSGNVTSVLLIGRDISALKETERQLRTLVENIPDFVMRFDLSGRYLYVSPAVLKAFTAAQEDYLGLTVMEAPSLLCGSAREHMHAQILQAAQGLPTMFEATFAHEAGDRIFDMLLVPERNELGNCSSVLAIGRDITQIKAAMHKLSMREALLRSLIDSIPDLIFFKDTGSVYLGFNKAFSEYCGHSESELNGKTDNAFAPPDVASMYRRNDRIVLDSGQSRHNEEWITYPDGREALLDTLKTPLFDTDGKIIGIIGISRDITERKRMEALLRKSELEFRTLAENSPDMIVRYDLECRRIYLNPAYERYTGIPLAMARNKTPAEAWKPLMQHEEYSARLKRVMATGHPDLILLEWYQPDGSLTSHIMHAVAEYDEQGQVGGVLVIGHNISELKATERRLEESRAQLQALTARREEAREEERKRIAREMHDELGQRLTALRMDVSVLRLRFGQDNAQLLEQVKSMMKSVDSTIQVVRNVASRLRPATLDMGIASAMEWLVEEFIQRSGIPCELVMDAEGIHLDDNQATALFRIVQESMTNIVRHAEAQKVNISLYQDDSHYVLEIEDDGLGFDTGAKRQKSFGLIGIEERTLMLGGELQVLTAPGQGTKIIVRIPTHTPREEL